MSGHVLRSDIIRAQLGHEMASDQDTDSNVSDSDMFTLLGKEADTNHGSEHADEKSDTKSINLELDE